MNRMGSEGVQTAGSAVIMPDEDVQEMSPLKAGFCFGFEGDAGRVARL